MGLADILLGRKKLKGPAQDRLFALSTARVTLDTELGLETAGSGGIVFKPLSAGEFMRAEQEIGTEEWRRVFSQARQLGVLQLGLSGGEPLQRRDLVEFQDDLDNMPSEMPQAAHP